MTETLQQLTLDQALASAARDDALNRVETHADPDWRDVAYQCVIAAAQRLDEFTTDAVIAELARHPQSTHEPRALGPVMMRAARDGIITGTDRFEKSAAVSRHRAHKQIWKSRLRMSA